MLNEGTIIITIAKAKIILARRDLRSIAVRKEKSRNNKKETASLFIGNSLSLNLYRKIKRHEEETIRNVGNIKNAEKKKPSLNVNKRLKIRLKTAPTPEPSVTKKVFL